MIKKVYKIDREHPLFADKILPFIDEHESGTFGVDERGNAYRYKCLWQVRRCLWERINNPSIFHEVPFKVGAAK
jgi:hypothetical protein